MGRRPSDMNLGDSFEIEYEGHTFEIEYGVQRGLYDGDGDSYHFRATMLDVDADITARAGFHFWRSHSRVAKIAAKRAIKKYKKVQEPSTPEKIKSALA